MNWFIDPIKNHYVDFEGRVTRKPFWMFVLITAIISMVLDIIEGNPDIPILSSIFSLAILLPNIAITARRLHDTDRSGWWQLLWLIPIVGWIILIVFLAQDSKQDNKYGPNPKGGVPAATPIPPPATPTPTN